jgi:hypothetical protein
MLNETDFIIPAFVDHQDRMRNLKIVLSYLDKIGAKNVYVREYFNDHSKLTELEQQFKNFHFSYKQNTDSYFNKMLCINEVFKQFSKSRVVSFYDVDVIFSKKDLIEASNLILSKQYDVVYPYNGYFYDVPAETVEKMTADLNTPIDLNTCKLFNKASHGGGALFDRETFEAGGMCNPNFKNVGYDDDEIRWRFFKLGYKIGRTSGVLLHLNHFRGNTSFNYNDFTTNNVNEVEKVSKMSTENLQEYIKTWK